MMFSKAILIIASLVAVADASDARTLRRGMMGMMGGSSKGMGGGHYDGDDHYDYYYGKGGSSKGMMGMMGGSSKGKGGMMGMMGGSSKSKGKGKGGSDDYYYNEDDYYYYYGKGKGSEPEPAPVGKGKGSEPAPEPAGKGKGNGGRYPMPAPEPAGKGKGGRASMPEPSGKGKGSEPMPEPAPKPAPAPVMMMMKPLCDTYEFKYLISDIKYTTTSVGETLQIQLYDEKTGMEATYYQDASTYYEGPSKDCEYYGTYNFDEVKGSYGSQIMIAGTCNGVDDAITGGTGEFACATGYVSYEESDKDVYGYATLKVCGAGCSLFKH